MYQVLIIRLTTGKPHPVFCRNGFPMVLPNLWADCCAVERRFNSVKSYLEDTTRFYEWADSVPIDLHRRFSALEGLSRLEMRSLAVALSKRKHGGPSPLGASTVNRRLAAIRDFTEFCFDFYIGRSSGDRYLAGEKRKAQNLHRLRKLMRDEASVRANSKISTALTDADLQTINRVLHPGSEKNPFSGKALRIRNYTIFHVLLTTFSRRGELVLLELGDIDLGPTPTITFRQPSDNNAGKRLDGANLKTLGRTVPIHDELKQLLQLYLDDVRPDFVVASTPSPNLFLSQRDGRRLCSSAVNQMLSTVQVKVRELASAIERLHPHGLRRTGYITRTSGQVNNFLTLRDVEETKRYLGGWSPTSTMPRHYGTQLHERSRPV